MSLPNPTTFSNWRVGYVAPTKPEHTFEPRCWIEADDAQFAGRSVRVFDVPDPDESQRAAAQFACDLLNAACGDQRLTNAQLYELLRKSPEGRDATDANSL